MIRLGLSMVWVAVLWGVLGTLLKIATVETPDWLVVVVVVIGAVAMWFSICLRELREYPGK